MKRLCVIGALIDRESKTVRPFVTDHYTDTGDTKRMFRLATAFARRQMLAKPGNLIGCKAVDVKDRDEIMAEARDVLIDEFPDDWTVRHTVRLVAKGNHQTERMYAPFDEMIEGLAQAMNTTMDEAAEWYSETGCQWAA